MRHSVYGKKLGRNKNQRTALFRGLIRSLVLQGKISTTESKAKAIKGLIDRLVVQSKKNTNGALNQVKSFLPQEEISQKLIKEIATGFKDRSSGFTQTIKLGKRLGDGAMMVEMSWMEEKEEVKTVTEPEKPKVIKTKEEKEVKEKEKSK